MANPIYIGTVVRLRAAFRSAAGVLADPTTVTLRHKDPSGNITTVLQASLSTEGTGLWYYDLTVDEVGGWGFSFEGAGTVTVSAFSYFDVRAAEF